MITIELKDVYKELAKKFDLDEAVVKEIVNSQFRLVENMIREGELKQILLPHFGRFYVKPKRKEFLLKSGIVNVSK